jgi:hypothetical protein
MATIKMKSMAKAAATLFFAALIAAAGAPAPKIKLDNLAFKGGTFIQNKDTLVNAVFRYANTGSAPLQVSEVRANCECRSVSYDTVVAPGQTGTLRTALNLKGFMPGPASRTVTIVSNAANAPSLTLAIEAVVKQPIEVSDTHLHFSAPKEVIFLSSAKKDLQITGAVFKQHKHHGKTPPPVNIGYKLTPVENARESDIMAYRLELDNPSGSKKPPGGNVLLSTNHPDQKEVLLEVSNHSH